MKKGNTVKSAINDDDDDAEFENLMEPNRKISIKDFTLLTVVGRGAYGKVFLVKKKGNDQPFAMKILKKA